MRHADAQEASQVRRLEWDSPTYCSLDLFSHFIRCAFAPFECKDDKDCAKGRKCKNSNKYRKIGKPILLLWDLFLQVQGDFQVLRGRVIGLAVLHLPRLPVRLGLLALHVQAPPAGAVRRGRGLRGRGGVRVRAAGQGQGLQEAGVQQ